MRYALVLEYDGRSFHGWQRQIEVSTVQGALEHALSSVAAHTIATTCAGRTDAGVHASAQVVHFDSTANRPPHAWRLGGNAHLPDGVGITWSGTVGAGFHARFSAVERRYRYRILCRRTAGGLDAGRAWCLNYPLDIAAMRAAAALMLGEHDFSAFRAASCQARSAHRRITALDINVAGDALAIDVRANAFLHNMVRIIVGVLVAVGRGEHPPRWVRELLEGRDRRRSGMTAPAAGLCLTGVRYEAPHKIPSFPATRF